MSSATRRGVNIHEILHHFEHASSRIQGMGTSKASADRTGMFLALRLAGFGNDEAKRAVERLLPTTETPAAKDE